MVSQSAASTPTAPQQGFVDPAGIYSLINMIPDRQQLGSRAVDPITPRPASPEPLPYCPSDDSSSTSTAEEKSVFSENTSAFTQATSSSGWEDGASVSVGAQALALTFAQTSAQSLPTETDHGSRYEETDGVQPLADTARLPCELGKYSEKHWKCDETFALTDIEGWVDHIAEVHFKHDYPPKSTCWFCDGKEVEFFTKSVAQDDRRRNFHRRMEHIAQHYQGANWERLRRRPDFNVINFLLEKGLINKSMKTESEGWSEIEKPRWWQDELPKTSHIKRQGEENEGWCIIIEVDGIHTPKCRAAP
ncbi:unnamed protein product [Clonostachys rosea f. rosea IK726]|uniref:Uncharacterized protein n=1 Tax=Clonostachys rosea f. rosea IK726 TaxID=1349383 RepID=A0ACA9USY5_BIOOC|nr:unnamed protein product [Clonostachys rosea f. rosea IK726]